MKTFKFALLLYPVYIIVVALIIGMLQGGILGGACFGVVSYPLIWFTFIIMNVAGENGVDTSKTGERANDNRR